MASFHDTFFSLRKVNRSAGSMSRLAPLALQRMNKKRETRCWDSSVETCLYCPCLSLYEKETYNNTLITKRDPRWYIDCQKRPICVHTHIYMSGSKVGRKNEKTIRGRCFGALFIQDISPYNSSLYFSWVIIMESRPQTLSVGKVWT